MNYPPPSFRRYVLLSVALLLALVTVLTFAARHQAAGPSVWQETLAAPVAAGDLDLAFAPTVAGPGGQVYAVAVQSDGKVIIGGRFTTLNGVARNNIARLNGDGTLDTAFADSLAGANSNVFVVVVQGDGKIVIGGEFATVNSVTRNRIARLNSDGTLDTTFADGLAGANSFVYAVAVQSDGKIVIGGEFTTVNGVVRRGIARLNSDGALDTAFLNGPVGVNAIVRVVAVQSDGKIVIGGDFTTVNGVTRNNIARLNSDGTLDTAFANGLAGANSSVSAIALQTDGKVIIGGQFTTVNGVARNGIARLNSDGARDTAFANSLGGMINFVNDAEMQSDGKIVIGGFFTTINGIARNNIARLNSNGILDTTFGNGQSGTDGGVFAIALQSDGKAVIGGQFTTVNNVARTSLARLLGDVPVAVLQFSAATGTANEGAGKATLNVTRTGDTTTAAAVDYATQDNFAFALCNAAGNNNQRCDYTPARGTLSFAAGETSKSFDVLINDDVYVESSETVNFVLSNPTGATLGPNSSAALTITDNDTTAGANRVFMARLDAAQEVPTNSSTATGNGNVTLNAAENQITVNMTFSGLSSAQTAAHIHSPAPVGVNAPVLFNLGTGQIANATFAVTPAQVTQMRAGMFYFNVHTANFPGGEIRGQIVSQPLENARFFVRQQYADFLSREPDQAGFDFWTGQIVTTCGADLACTRQRRVDVSNAFFFEQEFQQTGAYVYRLYRAAYGNMQPFPNPETATLPNNEVFVNDRARVVGGASLAAAQLALANAFTARAVFLARYPAGQTAAQFVDAIVGNIQAATGANLTSQRDALIALHGTGGRGAVVYRLADDNAATNPINNRAFIDAEYNRAFVLTQYYGYLRRDADFAGFNFWLGVVNQFPLRSPVGQNGMVCAFITSQEYQERFSLGVTRANQECP